MHTLIAVLDWGLGHASRSIALAQRLRAEGERISWAAAGQALEVLRRACPNDQIHVLPAYDIRYQGHNMHLNMARQLPKIVATIRREHQVIDGIVRDFKVARLISDSRFGAYSSRCPSIFLTHQLHPIFGVPLAGYAYRQWLQRFDEYWVPDQAGPDRLSGKLSDPSGYQHVKYIGYLSRLAPYIDATVQLKYDHVCLLSGPEPQRSYLEQELLNRLSNEPGKHLIIRGVPNQVEDVQKGNCSIIGYTDAALTAQYLQAAHKVICRSGYSTLMDLRTLQKTNVELIPTPGQTEQLYLAERWTAASATYKTTNPL